MVQRPSSLKSSASIPPPDIAPLAERNPLEEGTSAAERTQAPQRERGSLAPLEPGSRDGKLRPVPPGPAGGTKPLTPGSTGPASRDFRTVALIVASALFMEQMDATVLATALPTMARDFGEPATALSSALTSYLLALAVFIPASGRIADRFGAKSVFRLAIGLFLAGSILCGQAHSLALLIVARLIQGAGGAMMIPVGRLVLLRMVAREDMVEAMSWMIMPATLGPIIGPPLGGFIVTYLNWRWIFYLNVPIGLLGMVLVTRYIDQIRGERLSAPDLTGFVLSGLCLGCLLFGFESVARAGGLHTALTLIATGIVAGGLYVLHAHRHRDPLLDLTLLRIPTFRLSLLAGSLTRITQGAQPFLLPLMFQLGFGFSAAASGSLTIAGALGSLTMKWLAPRVLKRYGFRTTLIVNGLAASLGYTVCALFRPGWPTPAIFAVLVIAGFFMSLQFTAYNTIAYDEIPPPRMSDATSFYATFQQLMLSMGICVGAISLELGMLVSHRSQPGLPDFTLAFLVVTAISMSATYWHMRFARNAGDDMSGRSGSARPLEAGHV